jgi:putative redox protein
MKVLARRKVSGANRILGFAHDVEIEGGHTVRIDEPEGAGGTDTGPSPTRLLAASLAACVAVTVEMYAARKGWDVGAVEVEIDAAYDDYVPRSFDVTLRLPAGLEEDQLQRLLTIAGKCPVHRALAGDGEISVTDRIETV